MRKRNSRDIVLHTESQFYLPGDEIIGTVTYHPKKQVSLRNVRVIFAGEEYCVWIDKVAARVGGPAAASRSPLFRKETNLVAERSRLEAGPHTWNFRFFIPRSIPPTCNYFGKASINYWLKAKAATSFGHFDVRFRLPVVIGQFWVPTIPAPVQASQDAMGGTITMSVKSSVSVVKCGDQLTLNVHFNNASHRNLTGVRVKLKQVWECTGVFYHKITVLKHLTKEGYPTSRGPHDTVIQLRIPAKLLSCPTVANATLFKCTYYIGVYGLSKVPGVLVSSDSIKCRVPITISNLPLSDDSASSSIMPRAMAGSSESDDDDSDASESDTDASARELSRNLRHTLSQASSDTSSRSLTSESSTSSTGTFDDFFQTRYSSANTSSSSLNSSGIMPFREWVDAQGNLTVARATEGTLTNDMGLAQLFNSQEISKSDVDDEKAKAKEKAASESKDADNGEPMARECIVCYDGQKNMLLLPCAHICTCISCTQYIMYSTKLCPVCRTKISQVMRIYPV